MRDEGQRDREKDKERSKLKKYLPCVRSLRAVLQLEANVTRIIARMVQTSMNMMRVRRVQRTTLAPTGSLLPRFTSHILTTFSLLSPLVARLNDFRNPTEEGLHLESFSVTLAALDCLFTKTLPAEKEAMNGVRRKQECKWSASLTDSPREAPF